ncbi:Uncharacterised protein [Klebsiella pneumoniae]|nr:Uncharacterised protein [Klebsiella pneumoniae]
MTAFKSQCTAFSRPIDAGQLLRQGAAGRSDQAMDSAWLVSLRVPQAPRSNTDPHVVAECPQPLARLHVPWRKLVWARPDDDFPEAAQANVRNCPVVAADRVPESGRNTSVAPDNVVQQYPSGQHTFPTPPPKAMANIALGYSLNANLDHKWIRLPTQKTTAIQPAFIPLPSQMLGVGSHTQARCCDHEFDPVGP